MGTDAGPVEELFDDFAAILFLEINRESHRQLVERMELVQPSVDKIFAEAAQELKREGRPPRFFSAQVRRVA